ncbi:hypothetical protein LJR074_002565 [Acidovorax sp. LjRoot74]|uniref:hypothetical protein n=1 Tax=Acidovorax sp. LjRoot74 TaxID=3342337 RepID=UPI003ECD317C
MSNQQSLADAAVETLAAVRAMDNGIGLDNPERHVIRDLKRNAEALIADALRRARELAYAADAIRELHTPREG